MKGGDLLYRLILDDSKFYQNLKRAQDDVEKFKVVGGKVTSMLTTMGGAFGVTMGAVELFDTAVNSNYITQTKFNDSMTAAKESVNSFFTSLSTGDWSFWEDGIINAIRLSKQYAQALRELKLNINIGDIKLSEYEKELNRLENAINSEKDIKQKKKLLIEFETKGGDATKYIEGLSKTTEENLNDILGGKGIKVNKHVNDLIFEYFDTSVQGGKELKKYAELRKELESTKDLLKNAYSMEGGAGIQMAKELEEDRKRLETTIRRMQKLNPELEEAFKLRVNFDDDEINELIDYSGKLIGYQDRLESTKKQVSDLKKEVNEFKKTASNLPPISIETMSITPIELKFKIPKKTLNDLKRERKEIVDKMNNSNQQDYVKLKVKLDDKDRQIQDFENGNYTEGEFKIKGEDVTQAIPLEFENDLSTLEYKKKKLIKKLNAATDEDDVIKIKAEIEEIENKEGKIKSKREGQKTAEDFVEGYSYMLANADFSTKEGRKAVANQTIESIKALIIARAIESAMALPFPSNLIAAPAAAMGVSALFSLIPKFEHGGIVGGNSTSGDKLVARVNSGEMILNPRQQANLYSMVNSNSVITTTSIRRAVYEDLFKGFEFGNSRENFFDGEIEFKIKGKDLVAVLSNYESKNRRI